ncbi:transposable element Tcb2 transposase [Trichonephila clavipes]|uniref:Transposable element Tcb2 transposase n=1 Tax=Trichonephila clavipes TaxID=2585209 RepID=A0A8X6WKD2_TRICX|nr:transposable element Tcb2 transposase [Trichonephila clavipes]
MYTLADQKTSNADPFHSYEKMSENDEDIKHFKAFEIILWITVHRKDRTLDRGIHWCAKIKDEVEKLAYQLNEEAEPTERPIRRLSQKKQAADSGRNARHTTQATARPISRFTVARRLLGGGLFARRPVRCVPLTPAHRRKRSLWCREHRNWRDNEWGRVLFTNESRFSLTSDSHRILIWRERGRRNHPSNIIERDRYGGRGALVWGGIMLGSRTDLHIFDAGSVTGTRYCNEILLPYVRLFRGAMGLQFLFMDDNAPCHRTVAAEQLIDIERMDWSARSPDLNPIEHVWDFLGRRLAARTLPPVTIRELRLALQDEWAAMPQQLIDTFILSMGRRCETCLAVRGDHIPY